MLDETWDEIHEVLARDCYDLFWDGLTVPWWHNVPQSLCYLIGSSILAAASRGIGFTFERLSNWNRVFVLQGFATTVILPSLDKSSQEFFVHHFDMV